MTRTANARIAGSTLLIYIAAGISSLVLFGRATPGVGVATKLAGIAQHLTDVRITVLLGLIQCLSALVLAVTFYAITRDEDSDLAMLGLVCRVAEGIVGAVGIPGTLALMWLATTTGEGAPEPAAAHALGAFLLRDSVALTATFFAVGSALFSYLLLRGRLIPVALAWIGVVASVLLVVGLPLQLAGFLKGAVAQFLWLPMLAFEVPLALWWILRGAPEPARR